MNEAELAIVRRAYAKHIMCPFGINDSRMEDAFANLRREDFLGPGPWQAFGYRPSPSPTSASPALGYVATPSDDPVYLYQDTPIGIVPSLELNNGQPSFLAFLISLGRLREVEHAVHIGCGVGYYTGVIAHLVRPGGKVTAIEYEPDLAERAARTLSFDAAIKVISGDGTKLPLDAADVILVNAGTTRPADLWLDALKEGGRLILPLTTSDTTNTGSSRTQGATFLIEKRNGDYQARGMSPTGIYPCVGARDEPSENALVAAFKKGGWEKVTRLYRTEQIPEDDCWVRLPGCSFAYR